MGFLTKELIYQKTPQQLTALLYEVCIDTLTAAHSTYRSERIYGSKY